MARGRKSPRPARRAIPARSDRQGRREIRGRTRRSAATGPVGESAVDAIERLQRPCPGGLALDGAEVPRMQPSLSGHRALLVGGEALDLPDGKKQVRKRDGRPAEDVAHDSSPSFRSIEVDDVSEFVGEDQAEPVVGAADELPAARPGGGDRDGVVRQGRCRSVCQLPLIGQHDVRQPRRRRCPATREMCSRPLRRCVASFRAEASPPPWK